MSVETIPSTFTINTVLDTLNVTALGAQCADSSGTPEGQRLARYVAGLSVRNVSVTPRLYAWSEAEVFSIVNGLDNTSPATLQRALASPYWFAVLSLPSNLQVVESGQDNVSSTAVARRLGWTSRGGKRVFEEQLLGGILTYQWIPSDEEMSICASSLQKKFPSFPGVTFKVDKGCLTAGRGYIRGQTGVSIFVGVWQ